MLKLNLKSNLRHFKPETANIITELLYFVNLIFVPSSFVNFISRPPGLDCFAEIPHFVFGEIFLKVSEEKNQFFISVDVVLLLFKSL